MRYAAHPVYQDPTRVQSLTRDLVDRGVTVFQLFQFPGGEREHSRTMLRLLNPEPNARVLSLGSGVGGMERYWHEERGDLEFELVNRSPEQHRMALCPGRRVLADAQGYLSPRRPFDAVVMAYLLGHVEVGETLQSAAENLRDGGKMLIADLFDSSPEFDEALLYDSPKVESVLDFAKGVKMSCDMIIRPLSLPTSFAVEAIPSELLRATTPEVFILYKGERDGQTGL